METDNEFQIFYTMQVWSDRVDFSWPFLAEWRVDNEKNKQILR